MSSSQKPVKPIEDFGKIMDEKSTKVNFDEPLKISHLLRHLVIKEGKISVEEVKRNFFLQKKPKINHLKPVALSNNKKSLMLFIPQFHNLGVKILNLNLLQNRVMRLLVEADQILITIHHN
jgi:hypothetical protein